MNLGKFGKVDRNEPEWAATSDSLMAAVKQYFPQPDRAWAVDLPFLMPIGDIFSISGCGTVVTGRIEQGKVKAGDEVEMVGLRSTRTAVVAGVEKLKKKAQEAQAGEIAGLLFRGISNEDVERGMVLAKLGSTTAHTSFKCAVYLLGREEGGVHSPFFNGCSSQFYFRTADVTGTVEVPAGVDVQTGLTGFRVQLAVELTKPVVMEEGLRFAIREGDRMVGAGTVSEIIK